MNTKRSGSSSQGCSSYNKKTLSEKKLYLSSVLPTIKTQKIDWKEAAELRSFPILWIGIIEDEFHKLGKECENQERLKMHKRKRLCHLIDRNNGRCFRHGRKECKDQDRLKMCRRNSMPERRRFFSMG